MGMPIVVVVR